MRPRRPDAHSGFTLLELVLVMAILLIVTAMAVPAFVSRGREVRDCAARLVALTNWARTQAIVRGVTYRLNVDPQQRTFWLTVDQGDGTFVPVGEEFGRVFPVPDGWTIDWSVTPQADGSYVEFRTTGRTDPATIRLTADNGSVTSIVCGSATDTFHVATDEELQELQLEEAARQAQGTRLAVYPPTNADQQQQQSPNGMPTVTP